MQYYRILLSIFSERISMVYIKFAMFSLSLAITSIKIYVVPLFEQALIILSFGEEGFLKVL